MVSIQRWHVPLGIDCILTPSNWPDERRLQYVLYSDYVVAVEAAYRRGHDDAAETYEPMFKAGRQQAVRDCIAAVEGTSIYIESGLATKSAAIAALRALLEDKHE